MRVEVEELEHERLLEHVGRGRDLLPGAGQRAHRLGITLSGEPIEQQRADLALELPGRPALARGFDLVERAGFRPRHPHQDEVVGPPDGRREARRHEGRPGRAVLRSGKQRLPDPPLLHRRSGKRCLPDLWKRRTFGKHEVKLADVAEGPDAEALAEPLLQARGQPLEHLLAVARASFPRLLDLHDLAADQPVGLDHRRVDSARDLTPRLLEDLRDPVVEPIVAHALNSSSPSPSSSSSPCRSSSLVATPAFASLR